VLLNKLYIFGANYPLTLVPLIALFVYWRSSGEQRRQLLLRGLIVLITGIALAKIGGMVYNEPRPFIVEHIQPLIPHVNDSGFPSDHTLTVSAIALLLAPFSLPAAGMTLLLAAIIGISRIGCHLHSVLDIMASFLFAIMANGIAWLIVHPAQLRKPR